MLGLLSSEDNNPSAAMVVEEEEEDNDILTSVSGWGLVVGGGGHVNESFETAEIDNYGNRFDIPVPKLVERRDKSSDVEKVMPRETNLHKRAKSLMKAQKTKTKNSSNNKRTADLLHGQLLD
jgi:hypothetical protein